LDFTLINVYTWITEVETINGTLGLGKAVWLQVTFRDRVLGLRPKLFLGYVCVDSAAEAAYAAIVALSK